MRKTYILICSIDVNEEDFAGKTPATKRLFSLLGGLGEVRVGKIWAGPGKILDRLVGLLELLP